MKIVILSGSPRQESMTVRVAKHIQVRLGALHEVELIDMRDSALPPIQHVYVTEEKTPQEHLALREKMFGADAFVFVSPEYNGGYSSVMKNFIDHFPKAAYRRKPIGIVTASDGKFGGMRAAQQLQQLICALFGIPCPQMLVTPEADKKFNADGTLSDESFTRSIDNFVEEYLWMAGRITGK
jgi:NAD(P)H-dependent FMN reductase